MATPNEIRGSKNLGLIKAIHSGSTPPLNIKIIWYDENIGQKIHKYYDVNTSSWIPFGNGGSVNGMFTYMAYASSCDGANFGMVFNPSIHTHTAIVTSFTQIPNQNLIPSLFENRWLKFCTSNGGSTGGNYTYIAFADDCEGINFSLSPTYEAEPEQCTYVTAYSVATPQSPLFSYSAAYNPLNQSYVFDFTANSPFLVEIDLANGTLTNGVPYYVNIKLPADARAEFYVKLDGNEQGGYYINHVGGTDMEYSFEKLNVGSKLFFEFLGNEVIHTGTMEIKVGNVSCGRYEPGEKIIKCRKYWGSVISDEPIENLDKDDFTDRWIPICCNSETDYDSTIENLQVLLDNLYIAQGSDRTNFTQQIEELNAQIVDLKSYIDNQDDSINVRIDNSNSMLTDRIDYVEGLTFQTVDNLVITDQRTNQNSFQLADPQFTDRVIGIIESTGGGSGGSGKDSKFVLIDKLEVAELNLEGFKRTIVLHTASPDEIFEVVVPTGQFDGQSLRFEFKTVTQSELGSRQKISGRFLKWRGNVGDEIIGEIPNITLKSKDEYIWSMDRSAWIVLDNTTVSP